MLMYLLLLTDEEGRNIVAKVKGDIAVAPIIGHFVLLGTAMSEDAFTKAFIGSSSPSNARKCQSCSFSRRQAEYIAESRLYSDVPTAFLIVYFGFSAASDVFYLKPSCVLACWIYEVGSICGNKHFEPIFLTRLDYEHDARRRCRRCSSVPGASEG